MLGARSHAPTINVDMFPQVNQTDISIGLTSFLRKFLQIDEQTAAHDGNFPDHSTARPADLATGRSDAFLAIGDLAS